ncbi:MAG: glycoside hydrolase family 16 protein [Verrucomicrobiales bacterium]|nr:glycoside hydrolase family 16 protein [Verrucomicrobiales bacterium]
MPFRIILSVFLISGLAGNAEETLPLSKVEAAAPSVSISLAAGEPVAVTVSAASKGYPGAAVKPPGDEFFDLSAYSRVEAIVRNSGDVELPVTMRVDNPGHWKKQPYSVESIRLAPGDTKTIVVFFGRKFGFQKGYDLDPTRIPQILFFTEGSDKERRFSIESLVAAGQPGETPEDWQKSMTSIPENGILLGAGQAMESASQIRSVAGASGKLNDGKDRVAIHFTGAEQLVQLKPLAGRWNLRAATRVEVDVANTGTTPAKPATRIESRSGSTEISPVNIPPGESVTIVSSFATSTPIQFKEGAKEESGFDSYRVESISIHSGNHAVEQNIEIREIRAVSPVVELPEWIGKRPPVSGDWELTFQEEFDGDSVDESKWNIYTQNYWDKRSHFSRENVIVGEGVVRLRFEHKTGRHNDDPAGAETKWQTGFLDTYDKWSQRYGYFEARMKLPTAPGLWPAFWAMPDRGPADGPKWKRSQTSRGGMEFDIVEHLTRWGPHRYNVAFHWDGYGKGHKHTGTSSIYVGHDRDGFITAGLLWLPGEAVYYCNGKVVARWESPRISEVPSILMFTHVSGGWDNDALDRSTLPDDFVIDYVRAWQRADLIK